MASIKLIIGLFVAGCTPLAAAQMHGGGHAVGFKPGVQIMVRHRQFDRGFFYGNPYLFADYPSEPVDSAPLSPQVVVVQPVSAAEPQSTTKAEPLLIELQGGRYVRISDAASQREGGYVPGAADMTRPSVMAHGQLSATGQTAPLPPAVLVYRDGHKEQVPDYAIVDGVIYARGDYWQSGYWTKQIQLSALNIPATIQANQEQGVKFVLPSGPNEVVTRP